MSVSRTHTASRIIVAAPRVIFRAFLDVEAVSSWRPPKGMTARIASFDARAGGGYRMAFLYPEGHAGRGKTTGDSDEFTGRFVDLVPDERIVEEVAFVTDDPSFKGVMRVTTTLQPVANGTKVTFRADDVPPGISASDHRAGMESSLKNLANFIE